MEYPQFPKEFIFGAATASYQIEGACDRDGRGLSVWDRFCMTRGKIKEGDRGDIACDHYFRYRDDVKLMKELGLDAYRFSIAWPRIFPEGDGPVNEKGIDFYSRLTDALLEEGITPFATLFHWDLPDALQRRYGGFADRQCADAFADYAETVARRLGDRVKNWITFNEPWVYSVLGHIKGIHAPGVKNPWKGFRAAHHQMLAHGYAVRRIREVRPDAKVGITLNLAPVYPASESLKDRKAADTVDQFLNRFYLDPLFNGSYPEEFMKILGIFRPVIEQGDMQVISAPIDFLGINNYTRTTARHSWKNFPFRFDMDGMEIPEEEYTSDSGTEYTAMGWEVYPEGIYELLGRMKNEYGNPPVYITENGAAFTDVPVNGTIPDPRRTAYLDAYIARAHRALSEGCNLRGYFVWTLMDNFEWAEGYSKRFGIIRVDYETQERTIKESGTWYAGLIGAKKKR